MARVLPAATGGAPAPVASHARGVPAPRPAVRLLAVVDVLATAVFALEGALAGVVAGLDVFGVLVVGTVTATGGGIVRDVLIGDVPPASLRQHRYLLAALAAGVVAIFFQQVVGEIPSWLLTGLDAAGLGLFAAAGTTKALQFGLLPTMAVIMGTITGVGGGTIRDLFLGEIPGVLRSDIYAVAALAGAVVLVVARRVLGVPLWAAMTACAAVTFGLRVAAVAGDWDLPVPGR
jgi:uncharacterized membrane protein YeiH